ncbi:N-acetyllactosaminide beta-1,3-N-acetylglucosaminyltransferase 3-like [Carcharodon carcharias]|uniref:N-acetyllactosaminide beta-1,3-N-acetylglucosaminyltransferase 3-like n=1 Tax=Carcharodon carcharias TaxID=13397 RepID=UPI001B7E624D|nr:N-acetyllactosaminide beta-1,3-N-acetylglucosaminyltransferase 3-like [Carcharodon carcharias]XP_041059674.1 N-acetyllactosaminide beta-1,3-N-acetylglucosaminyltransferase 3-like [Carcharodon carcharias]
MRHHFRLFEKVALVCIGVLGLVFIFTHNSPSQRIDGVPKKTIHPISSQKISIEKPKPAPLCKENASVLILKNFAKEPPHIKDFLTYKHCRKFNLIQNVPEKCGGRERSHDVFLLLVIKSNPINHDRREMVRRTWGKEQEFRGVQIRRVFITAVSTDQHEQWKLNWLLDLENRQHQDILQWDFLDTFFNLTLKQYKLMEWMDHYCPKAQFIFNGDDDVFVNIDNTVEYLLSMDASQHLYVGYLIYMVGPIREKWSKYYVSELVTAAKSYPPYIAGGGILMSRHTAGIIYKMARIIEFLPIDDVFMGMCLEKAGLAPKSHMGFRVVGVRVPSPQDDSFNPCYYRELILVHRFKPYELLLMWEAVHNSSLRCGRSS